MFTGKRTETRHRFRDVREQAAALAKVNPKTWEEKAQHLSTLNRLVHKASDLRYDVAVPERDEARLVHGTVARQWHQTYDELIAPLLNAMVALKSGNTSGLETVVDFLEADPYFYRSGYLKAEIIPAVLRSAPFSPMMAARVRHAVLNRVRSFWGREFPYYKRLAKAVDTPELRNALQNLLSDSDTEVQCRAASILRHLNGEAMPYHPR